MGSKRFDIKYVGVLIVVLAVLYIVFAGNSFDRIGKATTLNADERPQCFDTETGRDPFVLGLIRDGNTPEGQFNTGDYCTTSSGSGYVPSCTGTCPLVELFCNSDGLTTFERHTCEYGCANGACNSCDESLKKTYYRDVDNDGFGGAQTIRDCSVPTGYVAATGDCNDADATIGASKTYYPDIDKDGFGRNQNTKVACTKPQGLFATAGGDCNDANVNINPGKPELCNNIDDNCNALVDDNRQCIAVNTGSGHLIGTPNLPNGQVLSCPSGEVSCGFRGLGPYLDAYCCKVGPTALFTIGAADPFLPIGTSGSDTLCPSGKVVCGANSLRPASSYISGILQIKCCSANGITVDLANKALQTAPSISSQDRKCPANQVMCGTKNLVSTTGLNGKYVDRIYCCPIK